MARYRRIDPYIWHDDKFPSFSDDAKLLFFHLLTTPRGNPLGCFVQGKSDMAEYLKWPMKRFAIPFKELLLSHRIEYHEETRLVLIPNYLKYNPLENENQAKMACKYLSELPSNSQFFQYLKQYLERYDKKNVGPLLDSLIDRIGNSTRNTEPFLSETEPEPFLSETEPEPSTPPTPQGEKVRTALNGFDTFWTTYPRKKSKGQAEKAWKALQPSEQLQAEIVAAIQRATTSADWLKDNGAFIPYPATWLNAKGWADEVTMASPLSVAGQTTKANMERLKARLEASEKGAA